MAVRGGLAVEVVLKGYYNVQDGGDKDGFNEVADGDLVTDNRTLLRLRGKQRHVFKEYELMQHPHSFALMLSFFIIAAVSTFLSLLILFLHFLL